MANSASGESVIQRITRILHSFDNHHPVQSLTDLAERADLPIATAYRMSRDMCDEGLLTRTPSGEYRIGLSLWELIQRSSVYQELGNAALPFMEGIRRALGHSVSLAILDTTSTSIIYVERLSSETDPEDMTKVARRLPALSTAPGQAIVAHSSTEIQEQFLATVHRDLTLTRHAVTVTDMRRRLAQARHNGYAHTSGLYRPNSSGTAVPIIGETGRVHGAISIVMPVDALELSIQVPVLQAAAHGLALALSQQLHHTPPEP